MKDDFLKQIEQVISTQDKDAGLKAVVGLIKENFAHYDWVGIYLIEGSDLVLHNFIGRPTQHTRIPISDGICGAAVREKKSLIVPDVNADPRYLSCSVQTKSEIVVPILRDGKVYGEIDVDSDLLDAFHSADRKILESVSALLQKYF